jgi:anti-sigma B factor antagonist
MEIIIHKGEEAVIVNLEGRLDTTSAPAFQKNMEELISQGADKIVLDCKGVEYLSSAGLRSLLVLAKKAGATGGCVQCCSLQPMVRSVFDVAGFTGKIPVFEAVEDALKE